MGGERATSLPFGVRISPLRQLHASPPHSLSPRRCLAPCLGCPHLRPPPAPHTCKLLNSIARPTFQKRNVLASTWQGCGLPTPSINKVNKVVVDRIKKPVEADMLMGRSRQAVAIWRKAHSALCPPSPCELGAMTTHSLAHSDGTARACECTIPRGKQPKEYTPRECTSDPHPFSLSHTHTPLHALFLPNIHAQAHTLSEHVVAHTQTRQEMKGQKRKPAEMIGQEDLVPSHFTSTHSSLSQ